MTTVNGYSDNALRELRDQGFVKIPNAVPPSTLATLTSAIDKLLVEYPYGFEHPGFYSGVQPKRRVTAPKPTDSPPTVVIQNVGFRDPRILKVLCDHEIHRLLRLIVGHEYYLSNTWLQLVPPNTPRLNYHKDPRGSVTLCVLLDDADVGMGNTCLVPRSHINTPPTRYCIDNVMVRHPQEIELTGQAGDVVLFSAETWHSRAANETEQSPRRLFFNFYSRTSKDTTAWNGVVTDEQVANAKSIFPPEYHHLFRVDQEEAKNLRAVDGNPLKRWNHAKSSCDELSRDLAYAFSVYGKNPEHPQHPGFLLPYTTQLTREHKFSVFKYLTKIRAKPVARELLVRPVRIFMNKLMKRSS